MTSAESSTGFVVRCFRRVLGLSRGRILLALATGVLFFGGCSLLLQSRADSDESFVVLYCAQDEVLAEPLLEEFIRRTGCKVRAVYDSEAVKTVGLANRLLAERSHPAADVFWGNEEFRTRLLASQGVFASSNGWSAFGTRTRRLVINTNLLSAIDAPKSLTEVTNARWRGRVSLAYPSFGTTSTHFMILRAAWGADRWADWCQALAANAPWIEEGNSGVVARVGRGQAVLGLTDSDDIAAGKREGLPVMELPADRWSLAMPNTVGIVAGARHPRRAEELRQFLLSPVVSQRLIAAGGLDAAEATAAGITPDWKRVLQDWKVTSEELEKLFRR